MADAVSGADLDQVGKLRMHGDEIDAERPLRQRLGSGDFSVEKLGRHRPARNHAESARIRYGRDQMAFRHPAHRAAEDRGVGAKKVASARHQLRKAAARSEEHTSELQSLMRISYAVFCLKKKKT